MASSKQRAVTGVPAGRWAEFGRALQAWREDVLGYKSRSQLARDTGVNVRLLQDLENNYRPGTYTKWALDDAERAYQVTRASMLAFLHGETDALARAPGLRQAPQPDDGLPSSPMPPDRESAVRPHVVPIWEHLLALAAKGVTDPSGADLFTPGSPDADAWDATAGSGMSRSDRAWLCADLQRRRALRQPSSDGAEAS